VSAVVKALTLADLPAPINIVAISLRRLEQVDISGVHI
jgi:hypothetical protein